MNCIKRLFYCVFIFLFSNNFLAAQQTTFYDINTIQKIEVHFDQPDWDYQLDTSYAGSDGYIMAQWIKINGAKFDSVGVKYKGNSSYNSTYVKNPVHIELNTFKEQSYQHFSDVKLGNNHADPSMIREVLSYHILENYMDCPRSNFAQLYINDVYIGLYANDESINKDFCANHFFSKNNTFIKCNPVVNRGPATKSNLKFLSAADSTAYFNFYEIKSDYGWNDLAALCDSVTNHASTIENTFDLDRVLWMLAFNNVLVNLDSYSGVFCQNYYLYKDKTNHYNPIVWDLNMAFGGFPFLGNLNSSMGSLTIANMQQLPLSIHATDSYWPLINAVMNNSSYKKMYAAHIRTIVNEMFADSSYISTASQLQSLVNAAVQSDTNKFYSYVQFQNALDSNYSAGSYMVPGIKTLMNARVNYLQSTPELSATPPVISYLSHINKELNSGVGITVHITNVNPGSVYLGYRLNAEDKFTKTLMYDDGLHNDGIANDNIYSASVMMFSDKIEYYIYAENNDAGIFSPERAEHEFHTLNANPLYTSTAQVILYPNPANNEINIFSGRNLNMDFEIVNTLGAVIHSGHLSELNTIDTKNWTRGVYFLHAGSTSKKLLIMHP